MSSEKSCKICLKVMINKQKSKVLFAEANSDLVDVLLSFLTLPMGKVVKMLENHYGNEAPPLGSITTLYRGLVNLDTDHFCVKGAKQMLLNPRSVFEWRRRRLGIIDDTKLPKYYVCQDSDCRESESSNVSMYSDIATCDCGKPLNREYVTVLLKPEPEDAGVFIMKSTSSFIISDDLRVVPVVSGFLQTLNNLNVTDTDGAELTTLTFEYDDIMDLFKFSLTSATPLTDLIINKGQKISTCISITTKHEHGILLPKSLNGDDGSKKMTLKVFLQKSTNNFLLAEATDEFVEFLYSFLVLPLGGVEFLSSGNTCLKNVDNLYRSVTDVIDSKYFTTTDTKDSLINPKLSHGYVSKNQFLPLTEQSPQELTLNGSTLVSSFKSSKGQRSFIKEETMYIVSDDLTVMPFSVTSSISITNAMGISLSDVKEMDLQIGMEEALRILKASLSSATVLTDALIFPLLNKLPKLQHQSKAQMKLMQRKNIPFPFGTIKIYDFIVIPKYFGKF